MTAEPSSAGQADSGDDRNQTPVSAIDGPYAWTRLAAALGVGAVGGVGMWSVAVVLPAVQAEFNVARGAASFPYAMTMLGLAVGGILMGRLSDLRSVRFVIILGAVMLSLGFAAASQATSLWQFVLIQGLVIGALGASTSFAPLVADITLWFARRRGIAVALCASGNYLAGAVWPTILQYGITHYGWRATYLFVAVVSLAIVLPLSFVFRRKPPPQTSPLAANVAHGAAVDLARPLGLKPNTVMGLLMLAGLACCIGMSMPQVHIVAYCGDLGYGTAAGAQMLSLMLGAGIISRLVSGWIMDRIGGLPTLLLGSALQGLMLFAFLPFDSLTALYTVSFLFGLVQGGIVPSYAIIVRELFPADNKLATRISSALMITVAGMALGGWVSGVIYDWTGSYRWAFLHGIAWNIVNLTIALFLVSRRFPRGGRTAPA
jgi:MFS family permease